MPKSGTVADHCLDQIARHGKPTLGSAGSLAVLGDR
jgi:hypothetical protein